MQCEVTMTGDGTPPLALVEGAPHTRKLIKAVASYAAAMADLAEAKDVAAAKANVDAAEKSIETLFTISVGAPAAGFTKAIAAIAKGRMTQARRNALLAAAREADPAIKVAADQLTEISSQSRATSSTVRRCGSTDISQY
jgi:transcription elongation GreA/GreB family factor